MWPSLANQSYLLARVIASRMVYVTYVGPGRAFPRTSEGTLRKMFSLSSVVIIWRDVSLEPECEKSLHHGRIRHDNSQDQRWKHSSEDTLC